MAFSVRGLYLVLPQRLLPASFAVIAVLVTGCQAHSSHTAPAVSMRTAASFVPSTVAQVQASVLYRQARQECRRRDYRHAASLLQTLARTPGLAPDAAAFCSAQRSLCLQDAGLSVPAAPALASLPARPPANADCGPRSLLLVCQKLGVKTDLQTLRRMAGTTAEGTTLEGLQQAAQKLGLQAEGVQVSRSALPNTALPAIAWINHNHYAALLALDGRGDAAAATIHDPSQTEEKRISQEQLLQQSSGFLLLVHR